VRAVIVRRPATLLPMMRRSFKFERKYIRMYQLLLQVANDLAKKRLRRAMHTQETGQECYSRARDVLVFKSCR
jgi:hypothetical protein